MPELSRLQQKHFTKMTRNERLEVIRDSEKQMGVIAMSVTAAAEHKRAELQSYIDFCRKLNRERP